MRRVLFVSHTTQIGGAERVLISIMAGLKKRSFDLYLALPSEGPLLERCANLISGHCLHGMNFSASTRPLALDLPLMLPRLLRATWRLWTLAGATQVEVIHANSLFAAVLAAVPGRLRKIPVVWHMHDIQLPIRMPRWLPRLLSGLVSRVVCVSNAVQTNLLELGVSPGLCEVNYDAAPTPRTHAEVRPTVRDELAIPPEAPLIGMVGRLARAKGQHVLIEAASHVLERFPTARFVLVGAAMPDAPAYDVEYAHMLERLARDEVGKSRVVFTGHRDDVASFLRELDVFVHSPVAPDPCPLAVSEAMRLGCQIVATETGGIPEQLTGDCGILVPPESPEDLAVAIVRILEEDPSAREARSARARQRAAAVFSQEVRVEHLLETYRDIQAQPVGRRVREPHLRP